MTETEKKNYERYKLAYAAFIAVYPFGLEDLDGEIWRWISGYEGDYQESNYGRTKSFQYNEPRIMVPIMNQKGYLRVKLHKNGVDKTYSVHILVGRTFVPNPEGKPEINHIDGNKFNNFAENLKWSTRTENIRHAFETGLQKQGADYPTAIFTPEQILEIRQIYIKGDSEFGTTGLAKKFGVSKSTIKEIVKGKSYKNVK